MRTRTLVLAALMAVAVAPAWAQDNGPPAPPTPGPHPGDQISFCGKVVPLVEAGCIGIVNMSDTYELTAVSPKPEIGTTIQGTGIMGGEVTKCMQGVHLKSASWSAVAVCTDTP